MTSIVQKRVIVVDSSKRSSGASDSSFSYSIVIPNTERYDQVCVLQCKIPKSYYLIQSGLNTFTLRENAVNAVITIPAGNYSALSFATVVGNLMTAQSATNGNNWTYTISIPTGITTVSTGLFTYTVTNNGASQPSIILSANNYLYEQFGFASGSTNTFVNSTLTSGNVVRFQLEDTLFIHSDIADNGQDDVLQEIFVASGDFTDIIYQCTLFEAYSKKLRTTANSSYTFNLTDENGQLINLNGKNMVLTLLLWRKDPVYDTIKSYMHLRVTEMEEKKN